MDYGKARNFLRYSHAVLVVALVAMPWHARAVVVRAGVADSQYVVADNSLPALADLPCEGQGVLIAKRWVLTAAHATVGYKLDHVTIGGTIRPVEEVIRFPGFKKLEAIDMSGDAAPLMAELKSKDDIALIRLSAPVEDIAPMPLYRQPDEQGKLVEIYGKGATGNGRSGQYPGSTHRGLLRRAYNVVTAANGRWLDYAFDCAPGALPLEGVMGDGDSGGPVLIQADGKWKLAGLASWKHWHGSLATFQEGVCGQTFSNVRVSHYLDWIHRVIAPESGS